MPRQTELRELEGTGTAKLFKGDTRMHQSDLDSWYQEVLRESSDASKRPYLYGSDAGFCSRRNVLLEHNTWIAGSKSPATAAYMAIGVGLEDMLASALKRNSRLLAQGQRIVEVKEVKISGKIDLIVFDHEDELALIEVKTCGELPTEIKPNHLSQIQTYAAISGIHRCWVTYISRNVRDSFTEKLSLRSFPVDCSEAALKGRLQTALISRLASDAERLPPVPATFRKHTECHYCEFRDQFCWAIRPGLRASHDSDGSPDSPPDLKPYSPNEMVVLYKNVEPIVDGIWNRSIYRKIQTLKSLSTLDYPNELFQKYMKERRDIEKELLSVT